MTPKLWFYDLDKLLDHSNLLFSSLQDIAELVLLIRKHVTS